MTESAKGNSGNAGEGGAPQVRLSTLAQYIRDLSFENLIAQRGDLAGDIQPGIQVQVGLDARRVKAEDNLYEVTLKVRIDARSKADNSPLFLLEMEYGGLFRVEGVPDEQLHPFLLIECPRQIFPFVRRIVSDVTRDGGFPPLNLETIDFVSLYRAELERQKAAAEAAEGEAAPSSRLI